MIILIFVVGKNSVDVLLDHAGQGVLREDRGLRVSCKAPANGSMKRIDSSN